MSATYLYSYILNVSKRDNRVPIFMSNVIISCFSLQNVQCFLFIYPLTRHSCILIDTLFQSPFSYYLDILNTGLRLPTCSGIPTSKSSSSNQCFVVMNWLIITGFLYLDCLQICSGSWLPSIQRHMCHTQNKRNQHFSSTECVKKNVRFFTPVCCVVIVQALRH